MMRLANGGGLALAAIVLAIAACDRSDRTVPADAATAESELQELAGLIKLAAHEKKPPPRSVKDFDELSAANPPGVQAVDQGRIVYAFGKGYDAKSTAILAYEKDAATQGGFVLLQDGTVKRLTAVEFQSAPKAK